MDKKQRWAIIAAIIAAVAGIVLFFYIQNSPSVLFARPLQGDAPSGSIEISGIGFFQPNSLNCGEGIPVPATGFGTCIINTLTCAEPEHPEDCFYSYVNPNIQVCSSALDDALWSCTHNNPFNKKQLASYQQLCASGTITYIPPTSCSVDFAEEIGLPGEEPGPYCPPNQIACVAQQEVLVKGTGHLTCQCSAEDLLLWDPPPPSAK